MSNIPAPASAQSAVIFVLCGAAVFVRFGGATSPTSGGPNKPKGGKSVFEASEGLPSSGLSGMIFVLFGEPRCRSERKSFYEPEGWALDARAEFSFLLFVEGLRLCFGRRIFSKAGGLALNAWTGFALLCFGEGCVLRSPEVRR